MILVFFAMAALSACSKEDILQQEMNRLRGNWDLKEITGGFTGAGYEADFTQLIMTNSNRYSIEADNSSIEEGDYTLNIEEDELVIRFEPDVPDNRPFSEMEKTIEFKDNNRKLILIEPCCDLYTYEFERTAE